MDVARIKISTFHNVLIAGVFLAISAIVLLIVDSEMRKQALAEARAKARIILDRNLATHAYFSHDLKPKLFTLTDPLLPRSYFEPTWMSSTFAIRQIGKYFQSLSPAGYYYKECAINARSPENEADAFEKNFIRELNRDRTLTEYAGVRLRDGEPWYVVLRRGEVMEEACLRCHSTPERAPGDLIREYGPEKSFGRHVGEVVSAVSIRVPLSVAYGNVNRFVGMLSLGLLLSFACLFLLQWWVYRRLVFAPLDRIRSKAVQISTDNRYLGDEVHVPEWSDARDLTVAFNTMSARLRHTVTHLEESIEERTKELNFLNNQLQEDIGRRKKLEEGLRALATTDMLTGLYNRFRFESILEREVEMAKRYKSPLSLIMFDIDDFKVVNDTYGHQAGDHVLKVMADTSAKIIRKTDYLCRWGGEEFMLLAPGTGLGEGKELAEKIRVSIENHLFDEIGRLTVSLGVTGFREEDSINSIIKRADDAMYRAKGKGKNRTEVFP